MSDLQLQSARESWYEGIDNDAQFRRTLSVEFCGRYLAKFCDYVALTFPEHYQKDDVGTLAWILEHRYPLIELFVLDHEGMFNAFCEGEFERRYTR